MLKSVAQLMTGSVPRAFPNQTVGEVLTAIKDFPSEEMGHVYLIDSQSHLVGQIPINILITAPVNEILENLVGTPPIQVRPEDAAETAALQAVTRHDADVAVVDKNAHLLGAVPIGRLLALLHEEHVDNVLRMGGLGTSHPDPAESYQIISVYKSRISWLIIGLFGGLIAGIVVGSFEEALQKELTVAFFLPLVVYMADAIGTQTETFLIRRLAHGPIGIWTQLFNEGLVGTMLGSSVGAVATAGLLAVGIPWNVAFVIGLTLFSTAMIASILASIIPIAFTRIGIDPAFASGPLATVLQDITSVAIYLLIANALI
jgi:magnesium transporter